MDKEESTSATACILDTSNHEQLCSTSMKFNGIKRTYSPTTSNSDPGKDYPSLPFLIYPDAFLMHNSSLLHVN